MYWPQSNLRVKIILLLRDSWPRGLTVRDIAKALPEYNDNAIRQALSDLRARGVVVKLARGVYALREEYVDLSYLVKTSGV